MSQTVWTGPLDGGSGGSPARLSRGADGGNGNGTSRVATALATATPTAQESLDAIDWILPSIELLEPRAAGRVEPASTTSRTSAASRRSCSASPIPAKVVAVNSGPVVTQYEVRPEHHVKVSRIEALADDLAMALAARSIRIEAPIPGKDVVGIEIPNSTSEVVGFRPLLDESAMLGATSPLTFALGRDVSGKAYAVDLAKMPHLLIAGATGSGKSVCVNALITSLLMRARPDEVRLILVDLKRVELAPYNGLPHLLQHVIVEPDEAKAVLNWAVREMEERYKLLAGARRAQHRRVQRPPGRRGQHRRRRGRRADAVHRPDHRRAGRPDHARGPEGRGPGRQDRPEGARRRHPPRARHAAAVGQRRHRPDQGQRPVTDRVRDGLDVDSRTVLDAPGAEDLIGRGDMLYQPVDLPRPVRMQGVFVSDSEVNAVTEHWLDQTDGRTFYDEGILAFADPEDGGSDGDGGQFAWLRKLGVDEMTVPAAELVTAVAARQHVDAPDQAQARLRPRQPGHGRARAVRHHRAAGPAQPGHAATDLRPGELVPVPGRHR